MNQSEALSKAGWSQAQLADLMTVIRGVSYMKEHASKKPSPGLIPILRATNIQSGLVFEDFVYVPRHYVSDEQLLRRGDIVIAASSGSKNIVGKAAQLTTDWLGSFGTFCFGLRAKPGVHPGYLAWFLQTSEYRHQVSELSAGVNINNLKAAHVEKIPIPVAPLPEQRRIVAEIEKQFTRLDTGVAALKRVQANLKRYRAAVLKAACEGRLVPTDGGWKRTTLGKVLIGIEAGRSFKCEERPPKSAEVGVVKVSAVTWGTYNEMESKTCLNEERIEERFFVRPEDFLFSRANTIELIGACVIAKSVRLRVMLSDKILRFQFSPEVMPRWILYWLRSQYGRHEIERLATGNQLSMRNIGQDRIRQISVSLPSIDEQTRITAEVERRLSVVEELETMISANLKRSARLRYARQAWSP